VTYVEVLVDGELVTRKGKVQEGEVQPGWMLSRPPVVNVKGGVTVYETAVPVGSQEVKTAFALSRIVETEWDPVVEAYGQRYETARVGPADRSGVVPVCDVREGRTCIVLAYLFKSKGQYAVDYDAKIK
jgi:hypothetical protein